MNRTRTRSTYRSALALALSMVVALACASWTLGAIAPQQAQAAGTKTISDVYGVTRSELVSWLTSHENDKYYLTTPYKPYDWRSPKGDINGWGANSDGSSAGMNCTGFVWHALCAAHGWKDGIGAKLPAISGWAVAIQSESLENYTFSTKEAMLESGKLEKGDIIWMWDGGDSSKVSDFHHIGIFWGDKSDEDLMWHSSGDANNNWSGINELGKIHGKAATVSYQVVKLGGKLFGGIALEKASSDESVTKDNGEYSLKGATYGVFEKKADAQTHDAKKALKTFSTDAQGKFESAQEFAAGTYYVAETSAPKGYALDEKEYKVEVVAGKTVKVNDGKVKDAPLLGGITLVKRSASSQITDGNACYSLKGAVYGVFGSKADAKGHDAGKALKTYKISADGSFNSKLKWAAGTYYVAETSAPAGYTLDARVYAVEVKPGKTTAVNPEDGFTTDAPKSNPVSVWAAKRDAETADGQAQGSASLAGALFEIAYYDGYYDLQSLPRTATRTWIVRTDEEGVARASDELKESGDEFYRLPDGRITIPLGTVTLREVQPPRGYLLGDGRGEANEKKLVRIEPDGTAEELGAYVAPEFSDAVARGGVAIGKVDRQNGQFLPQGAATLEGAVFQIVTDNEQQVLVEGTSYAKGQVVGTIAAELAEDGRCIAQTPDDLLPVGSYTLTEVEAGEGYVLDDAARSWSRSFEVSGNGEVVDLTDPADSAGNQVARGDFGFSKVDGQTDARLGLIPFLVTSRTTGESHVIMTDENGMASTASSWNAHGHDTNANDGAVSATDGEKGGYAVDEEALDPAAGVWFDGRGDAPTDPDDALGALPYDTYDIEELRVSANEGYELASFTVRITRHARELDLGTVDDNPGPVIGTTLTDGNGEKLVPAGAVATLVDAVHYANLDMRETYTLLGELHLVTSDGEDGGVIAEGSAQFRPEGADGTVNVEFSLDTSELGGARLVAFERLLGPDGSEAAVHEDLGDEGQTVSVPSIGTTLCDAADGDHGATADEAITLVDTVAYRGLTPGKTYVMAGTLHMRADDGADGGPAVDEQGRQVVAYQAFTPETPEGEVEVVFSFAAPNLAGKTTVAFEELTRNGRPYAVHADIADEEQTVRFPPPHSEEGKPPAVTPPVETPPVETAPPADNPPAETPTPGKSALPRTGDGIDVTLLMFAAAAALGLGAAALCIRKMQRDREITINRGPDRTRPRSGAAPRTEHTRRS